MNAIYQMKTWQKYSSKLINLKIGLGPKDFKDWKILDRKKVPWSYVRIMQVEEKRLD